MAGTHYSVSEFVRIFLLLSLTIAVHAGEITGKVVGVADGDTITVLTASKDSLKVRLYGIDAPESKQAFGNRAKQELSGMVFGRVVIVDVKQRDRYGRTVGLVTTNGVPVNQEMVRRGLAWWYRDYAKKDVQLAKAEAEAKSANRGLWSEKAPVPPWEFRHHESASRRTKEAAASR